MYPRALRACSEAKITGKPTTDRVLIAADLDFTAPPTCSRYTLGVEFPELFSLLLLVYASLLQQRAARLCELAIIISGQLTSIQRMLRKIAYTASDLSRNRDSEAVY